MEGSDTHTSKVCMYVLETSQTSNLVIWPKSGRDLLPRCHGEFWMNGWDGLMSGWMDVAFVCVL